MKKFLALALILTLALALSVTTFAAHIVGSYGQRDGEADSYLDGVDTFSANNPTYDVNITVSAGAVQHRYAVDITYDTMNLAITASNLAWDVNELKYVTVGTVDELSDKDFEVTVTNYSDQPVYLTATITDTVSDGVTVATYKGTTKTNPVTHNKTEMQSAAITKTPVTETFYVNVSADTTWTDVANYYSDKFTSSGTISIATCTITIADSND